MSSKQDAVATRTAVDLERKYSFGKTFAEVMGYATDAQNAAEEAKTAVAGLNQEEIFKRLTNNGQAQGIYRDPDTGEIYINASYLATGTIASADGSACIDLSSGIAEFFNGLISNGLFVRSKATDDVTLFYVSTANNSKGKPFFNAGARSADGNNLFQLTESFDGTSGEPSGAYMQIHSADGSSSLHMSASNDRVGVSLYGSSGISGVALSVDENGTGNVFTNKINGKPVEDFMGGGNNGAATMVKLWENPNPSESFAAQTVTVDLTDYDMYMVLFIQGTGYTTRELSVISRVGKGAVMVGGWADMNKVMHRSASAASSGLTFANAYYGGAQDNAVCIPVAIYGIRGVT